MNRFNLNRRIILIVAFGAAVVLIGLTGARAPLQGIYDLAIAPAARMFSGLGAGISSTQHDLARVSGLASENSRLERENAQLRQRLAADAETRRDNELLRQQLGLEVAGTGREIAAEVVAFQPDSYRQFITVNKGSADGLKTGQAVLSEGVVAGILSSVSVHSSKVILITDPEFKLAAKAQESSADGIVQGQLGGGLVMQKIDQTKQVKPGDTVTTAGLGGLVPAGLLIGQVQSVDARDNIIFQSAQIATTLDPSRLRFVFVVAL